MVCHSHHKALHSTLVQLLLASVDLKWLTKLTARLPCPGVLQETMEAAELRHTLCTEMMALEEILLMKLIHTKTH